MEWGLQPSHGESRVDMSITKIEAQHCHAFAEQVMIVFEM